jgi:Trk K+ transport system NAD-binding subunit
VLCGDDTLAFRMAAELTTRYGEDVTVILPSRERNHGPRLAQLPNVHVIERPGLSAEAFRDAQIGSARALALLHHDDMRNFYAALRARELNPGLRLVLHIFNTTLGYRVQSHLPDSAVLAGASVAAPSFVAAALGEPAPSHARLSRRTLYVTRRGDVDPAHLVCGLASTSEPGPPRILPENQENADLVLAVADGPPRDPLLRRDRSPARAIAVAARAIVGRKLGIAFLALLAVVVTGFVVLVAGARYAWPNALYLTLLDVAGAAVTNVAYSAPERVAQVMLTFAGMAFIPTVTAAIVSARLGGSRDKRLERMTDHVIVVGLGKVGTRVVGQLHDLGHRVVCVDLNEQAFGVPMTRRLGIPVVIGPSDQEDTLRAARIEECRALVCVTSKDAVNLETAMHARAFSEKLRIVLRLFDDDLAERVEETVGGNIVSRSVSYLAAPSFAVAMLEHQVLRTIPVGRHVLLIAEVPVEAGAELAGCPVEEVHEAGQARVIALRHQGIDNIDWTPHQGYLLAPQDHLIVIATRAGLGHVLARSMATQEPGLTPDHAAG